MKKTVSWSIGTLLLVTALFWSGCAQKQIEQPSKPAQEIIREGMGKLSSASSYTFTARMNADVNGPEGRKPDKVVLDFNFDGGVDVQDRQNVRFQAKIDGTDTEDQKALRSASVDLRFQKDTLYFMLSKLQVPSEELSKEFTDNYVNKWFQLPVPAEVLKALSDPLVHQGDDATLTPEQKKIKDLYEKTNFLSNPLLVGMENVAGEESYHYSSAIDKKNLLDFIRQVADIQQGSKMSDESFKEIEDGLAKFENTGVDIWVGKTSGIMNRMSARFKLSGTEVDPNGTFAFDATFSNLNKPFMMEVPANANLFPVNPFALLGGY